MHRRRHICFTLFFLITSCVILPAKAQLGFELDIKKPKSFEDRELKAEKTGEKKFTVPRRVMQSITTHYNYFFNASTRLNEIIERAKASHKDDYATLLPFYNYSLLTTTSDSSELDSVIHKSKTGIVLHDLRNDWIDDLYLLWGAAYYLQQQYDSAYQMFQFINYAFAEKEKDGYYKYIGSRLDGNNALSIATPENESLLKRIISDPPGRNNAFIWQIRTLIQGNAMPEAGSLIATLKNDPNFPGRLHASLEEVQALWFYKQRKWDSAATHLVNALGVANSQQEKARWEFLAAQLYERAGLTEQAEKFYTKSISHTTDPVMDIYARLNLIRINKAGGEKYIDENIATLLTMVKRDKYSDYRDVIYSMAAQMELERGNLFKAQEYLVRGARYKNTNVAVGNRTFMQLADLYFSQKKYKEAAALYDSVRIENFTDEEVLRVTARKEMLAKAVKYINTIERQDSLQRIAALPEQERTAHIKSLVRQLRRQQGLREEDATTTASTLPTAFEEKKGEWYFYNAHLKKQGAAVFKQVWGDRPNVDNWRRFSDVTAQLRNNSPNNTRGNPPSPATVTVSPSFDALVSMLPLTPEQLQASNDSIRNALYALGTMYINDLEDYSSAINTFEELRNRFPQTDNAAQVLFNLYYSYNKTGDAAKAAQVKKILAEKYAGNRYAAIVITGTDPAAVKTSPEITKEYERIYDLFLEGNFAEARLQKQRADAMYQINRWSPQLLYIEAVYHTKQREDSIAKQILTTLIQQNAGSPLAAKAANLVQVLNRRKQIEDELTALQIERPAEEVIIQRDVIRKKDVAADTRTPVLTVNKPVTKKVVDTVVRKPVGPAALYTFNSELQHYAVVVLNKVDVIFGNEAKNAFLRYNREKYYNQPLQVNLDNLNTENKLLLIGAFINAQTAVEYVQKAKLLAGREIVPWLKGEKYSFTIISEDNLAALKSNTDIIIYKKFLEQYLPGKF
ncbi:MAG: tetratricopeptide repeat protein [Chitinophagaceae bacterium]